MGASLSLGMAMKPAQTSTDEMGVSQTGGEGGTTVGQGGATEGAVAPKAETTPKWPPDLCGLEKDGPDWRNWQGPKRLKECILSPEEKQKCEEIIAKVFHPDTIQGVRVIFHPDDVMFVMRKVREYLKHEPMLIEDIPFGVQIVGDLHGQLFDLERIFDADAKDGKPGWECTKYLFLGDYVDRGRQSIELIMALFSIKMLFPDNVILLRGNHEFAVTNLKYGFFEEFHTRYLKETADMLYHHSNLAFNWLSIAALVGDRYFCCHGGISPSSFTRRQLRGIRKPKLNSNEDVLMHDIVWSDPAIGLKGSCFNKDRGTSIYFGFDALAHALESMQVAAIVRAHSRVPEGFDVNWNCCVTVFSATDNCEANNKGATAIIDAQGKISFRIFLVDPGRREAEKMLKRLERPWEIRNNVIKDGAKKEDKKGPGVAEDEITIFEAQHDCDAGTGIKTITGMTST